MPENKRTLLPLLVSEKKNKIKGSIYNRMQVDFAFNSNHIEGSRLTHEQTRYIYETHTIDGLCYHQSICPQILYLSLC